MSQTYLRPDQLAVGVYVMLDMSWMEHGFLSSSFKIKNDKQIAKIRTLGLKQVRYDPGRSDVDPLLADKATDGDSSAAMADAGKPDAADEAVDETAERQAAMQRKRQQIKRNEKNYREALGKVRGLMQSLKAQPIQAAATANEVVGDMVGTLMDDHEATVHMVHLKGKSESSYYHAINVTILSLTLGKQLGLDKADLLSLGAGALFHDMGHGDVPDKVLRKPPPLSPAEQSVMERHVDAGMKQAARMGGLPAGAQAVIAQHHESFDGSGYPNKLQGEQIHYLARIVAVIDAYDDLCNPLHGEQAMSPYEAMSHMFAKQRPRFDPKILSTFIANMGVYPPGTVVRLNNGDIASVVTVNPGALLKPTVMIYDPSVPKAEALVMDLSEEQGVEIKESLRRDSLPTEAIDYLDLSGSVNYIFDSGDANA